MGCVSGKPPPEETPADEFDPEPEIQVPPKGVDVTWDWLQATNLRRISVDGPVRSMTYVVIESSSKGCDQQHDGGKNCGHDADDDAGDKGGDDKGGDEDVGEDADTECGSRVIAGTSSGNVYRFDSDFSFRNVRGHTLAVTATCRLPSGLVATGSDDRRVNLWSMADPAPKLLSEVAVESNWVKHMCPVWSDAGDQVISCPNHAGDP